MAASTGAARFSPAIAATRVWRLAQSGPGQVLGLIGFFSVAAVVQTWPLALHLTDHIQDSSYSTGDTYQSTWNLWWVKHALVDLQTNPFHTDLIFYPEGADLYLHTLGAINGVLSIPLQVATDNIFLSWNLLSIALFVFSALGAYALSYRVNQSRTAALVSAYIFAFSPFFIMQLNGRWHLAATWPIPLLALFLVRLKETGRLREAVGAGVCWALLTYNNLEYAVDAALLVALFLFFWSVVYLRRRDWRPLRDLGLGYALVAAVWFIVSLPLLVPTLRSIDSGEYNIPGGDEYYSADLLAFVTPSPLWGPGREPVLGGFHATPIQEIGILDSTLYLGILPLSLAVVALMKAARESQRVLPWAAVFIFFLLLSLGPYLYVDGSKTISIFGASLSIPLPYQILDSLPVAGGRRIPARMIVFGILGLSVLAGSGLTYLTSALRQKRPAFVPLLAILALGVVILEFWNPPVNLSSLHSPSILREIADEPGEFAVLHVPWGRYSGSGVNGDFFGAQFATYYQTFHHKATLGGYLARVKESDLRWVRDSGLWYLACPACPEVPTAADLDPAHVRQLFRQYRIRYVIVHGRTPHNVPTQFAPSMLQMDTYLRNVGGLTAVYSDDSFTVYRNDEIE